MSLSAEFHIIQTFSSDTPDVETYKSCKDEIIERQQQYASDHKEDHRTAGERHAADQQLFESQHTCAHCRSEEQELERQLRQNSVYLLYILFEDTVISEEKTIW